MQAPPAAVAVDAAASPAAAAAGRAWRPVASAAARRAAPGAAAFRAEVERPVFEQQLCPWLAPEFESVFQPRRVPAGHAGPEDGCSFHVRRAAFEVLAPFHLRFSDVAPRTLPRAGPGGGGAGGGSAAVAPPGGAAAAPLVRVVDRRDEGAVGALLRHRATGRRLLAASTHLFWDPNYPDVKLVHAAALCRGVAEFLDAQCGPGAAGRVPVVIGGDFNTLPGKWASDQYDRVPAGGCLVSGAYQLLTRGSVGPDHPDHPIRRSCAGEQRAAAAAGREDGGSSGSGSGSSSGSGGDEGSPSRRPGRHAGRRRRRRCALGRHAFDSSGLRLESMHVRALGAEPPLTTRTATFDGTLDYLFLSAGDWEVAAVLSMPYAAGGGPGGGARPPSSVPVGAFGAAPNAVWPSDHLAVGAELVLLPEGQSEQSAAAQ
ncbi:hypothetical protein Rsub_02852 [Raphidocelis subcapitata]|uniref:Uncharacterized protein n=1 Tax=Raphidocelis subcapitata TaxID=307507 RepID=A0A2V0NSP3_9CHLO|nr:hypothetical protein Rsub_02852 [Raphidocelis subcapitata]|eukprot:GBF89682.1 hypothetical protein Rsub_02852 [Raphidocelis subcapitata]